jgi:hypothetical protein
VRCVNGRPVGPDDGERRRRRLPQRGAPAASLRSSPAARHGYVWAPGYWNARNNHHYWQAGHWERARKGYHYNQSTWVEHDNRWQLERGHWNKGDRDGDGVPNKADHAPDNPQRN